VPGPDTRRVGAESLDHRAQLGHRDRTHLALGGPEGPPHATAHQADRLLLGRAVVPGGPVGGTDRGQAKVDRCGLGGLGQVSHVEGHSLRAGWQRCHPVLVAPGGELRPAGAVDTGRVLGPARSDVVPCVGGDLGQLKGLLSGGEERHGAGVLSFPPL
jgi:hypothetical protein